MVTSFFIDKAEVSNGAWYEFVRLAGGRAPDYWQGNRPPSNMMQMPVHAISWYEAQQYAAWIGKRLPTELEWEFAVAGGIANESPPRTYPWGNRFKEILRNPNDVQLYAVSENRGDVTPDGILNAAGNVAEWTTSGFANYDGALIQHPDAGSDFRVIRGAGELDFALHNLPPHRLQQTHQRWYASPKARIPGVGFRCALDAVLGISN
jgi:formylglycine-generating enzyme required for sulfatase activity